MKRVLLLVALSTAMSVACSGACGRGANRDAARATTATPEEPPVKVAVVEGIVKLREGAENPTYDPPTGERPAPIPDCTPPQISDRQPLHLGEGRGLGGVLVTASQFEGHVPHTKTTHRVEIRDCRLEPRLVVATIGDTLEVTNKSRAAFVPMLSNDPFMQALVPDQTRTIPLETGGVVPLQCTFGTECARTDIVVLHYPVHAISGDGGRFRLDNVPVGQELSLAAWHPLIAETMQRVTVPEGGLHDLVLEVAPPAPVVPPEPRPEGRAEDQPGLF